MPAESLEDLIADVSGLRINADVPISASFIENKTTKTAKLVNSVDENEKLKTRHKWTSIRFREPLLVFQIRISGENLPRLSAFDFEFDSITQSTTKLGSVKNSDGTIVYPVNDVVKEIRFRPPTKLVGEAYLTSIQFRGITLRKLQSALPQLATLSEFQDKIARAATVEKDELAQREEKLSAREHKIPELNQQIDELTNQAIERSDELEDLKAELSSAQTKLEELKQGADAAEKRQSRSESTIEEHRGTLSELSSSIIQARTTLKELNDDINLFPTEFREYVNEGAAAIEKYSILAMVPVLILVVMIIDLFSNASGFVDRAVSLEKPAWELLLLRLPYVVVALAIITASWKISVRFIEEMVKVYRQRLDLSKVSIIAKDISDAASSAHDLSPEETADNYMWVKMTALRASIVSNWDGTRTRRKKSAPASTDDIENVVETDDAK